MAMMCVCVYLRAVCCGWIGVCIVVVPCRRWWGGGCAEGHLCDGEESEDGSFGWCHGGSCPVYVGSQRMTVRADEWICWVAIAIVNFESGNMVDSGSFGEFVIRNGVTITRRLVDWCRISVSRESIAILGITSLYEIICGSHAQGKYVYERYFQVPSKVPCAKE